MDEDAEHYASVLLSFREYEAFLMHEIFRRKKHLQALREEYKQRLPDNSTLRNLPRLVNAAHQNQIFLEKVLQVQLASGPFVDVPVITPKWKLQSPLRHFAKLKSTLHQCVRDWAVEGAEERAMCYTPILQELQRVLPVHDKNRNQQRVLVPGAGLGRLALEIASNGYSAQGNEFSYQMLFTSNFLLNATSTVEQFTVHPWIDNPSNTKCIDDLLRAVTIPDVSPAKLLRLDQGNQPDFSMCAGEFLEAYANDTACWDCIVTCFFIDAAPNVIEYIEAFSRMLRPGGFWINLGPLLYHWQHGDGDDDERYNRSVELTYEEIKHVACTFQFEFVQEQQRTCHYTCNIKSMMRTVYDCMFFTAKKT